MSLIDLYQGAVRDEKVSRLRRLLVLRALVATGVSQREIAATMGVTQSAVSQRLAATSDLVTEDLELVMDAAGPVLRAVAEGRGYRDLAVFGSVARRDAGPDSDVDLLVRQPQGTTISQLLEMRDVFQSIIGRRVDLVTYGALKTTLDDDIRAEAVLL